MTKKQQKLHNMGKKMKRGIHEHSYRKITKRIEEKRVYCQMSWPKKTFGHTGRTTSADWANKF